MIASLTLLGPPENGRGETGPVAGSLFPFNEETAHGNLWKILAARPQFAPRLLAAIVAYALCDNSTAARKLCACGCGASVTGKARCASPACRKRRQRERDAIPGPLVKQFNLVIQYEICVTIPTVPVRSRRDPQP